MDSIVATVLVIFYYAIFSPLGRLSNRVGDFLDLRWKRDSRTYFS